MSDDQYIVRRVLEGDREAYRVLVERHQGKLLAILTRMVGDADQAEELAQESFVRAYEGLGGFRGEARFSTWLIQIGLHLARNHLRKRTRMGRLVSLEESPGRAESWPDPRDSSRADAGVERHELGKRLERALTLLPDDYREVFVLKHVEDMGYEEIARITGDSVGSLKVRNHRARVLLRGHLREGARLNRGELARNKG